ncbi:unnamed protein product [Discosporangium mesarthrocarpum]
MQQGWRVDMEDAHTIVANVAGLQGHSFVAVYDGHGGGFCANYAGGNMMRHITETEAFKKYASLADKKKDPEARNVIRSGLGSRGYMGQIACKLTCGLGGG